MSGDDGDRLLPGERPDTPHVEDAEHWEAVYTELLAFARTLDIDSYVSQYERRLGFWQMRRHALGLLSSPRNLPPA